MGCPDLNKHLSPCLCWFLQQLYIDKTVLNIAALIKGAMDILKFDEHTRSASGGTQMQTVLYRKLGLSEPNPIQSVIYALVKVAMPWSLAPLIL